MALYCFCAESRKMPEIKPVTRAFFYAMAIKEIELPMSPTSTCRRMMDALAKSSAVRRKKSKAARI
jgi:hypothetical protein